MANRRHDPSALRVFSHATHVAIRIACTPAKTKRKAEQAAFAVYANAVALGRAARDILGRAPRYRVEVHDGTEWVTAAREDLLEAFDDDTRALPTAHFDTRPQAEAFITTMCGLMHCGGDPVQFRVIDEQEVEPEEPEPAVDDSVKACPDCDRPNQFGEVCAACQSDRDDEARDRAAEDAREWAREMREHGYDDAPSLPEPWWRQP